MLAFASKRSASAEFLCIIPEFSTPSSRPNLTACTVGDERTLHYTTYTSFSNSPPRLLPATRAYHPSHVLILLDTSNHPRRVPLSIFSLLQHSTPSSCAAPSWLSLHPGSNDFCSVSQTNSDELFTTYVRATFYLFIGGARRSWRAFFAAVKFFRRTGS